MLIEARRTMRLSVCLPQSITCDSSTFAYTMGLDFDFLGPSSSQFLCCWNFKIDAAGNNHNHIQWLRENSILCENGMSKIDKCPDDDVFQG